MELSKQQDTYMDIQKRRTFIISFIYFGIIGVLCYIGLKKLLPILIPFMAAMAIAAMLEPAVSLLDRHMKGGKGAAAAVVLLVFYGSILTIMRCRLQLKVQSEAYRNSQKSCRASTARPSNQVCPISFPCWKTVSPDTASTYQPLDKAWSVSWKMLLWASPPDCLGGAPLP